MKELIVGATIINGGRRFGGWVETEGYFISAVGEGFPSPEMTATADKVTDLDGAYLIPGVIDTHVHFRDGGDGKSPKGDIASESAAAIAGGVTTVFDMPNTAPPAVSSGNIKKKTDRAEKVSKVNYAFFIGATNGNINELKAADYTRIPGVKIFMGASTGDMLVDDSNTISRIFKEIPAVKAVHAEDQHILDRNLAELKEKYSETGEIPIFEHPAWRNTEACVNSTEKAMELARRTGSRLHICHISTAAEARLLTPGNVENKKITAETCPQYLIFGGQEDYLKYGSRIKCNPAIKEKTDAHELLEAVIDGRIDTIATDHAPHLPADKKGDLLHAASGMPGIQYSLRLMIELSKRNPRLTLERIVELMAHNPAKIFRIDRRGFIQPGMFADLVAFRDTEPYTVTDSDVISGCGWTPYAGISLSTEILRVWVNGADNAPQQVTFRSHTN